MIMVIRLKVTLVPKVFNLVPIVIHSDKILVTFQNNSKFSTNYFTLHSRWFCLSSMGIHNIYYLVCLRHECRRVPGCLYGPVSRTFRAFLCWRRGWWLIDCKIIDWLQSRVQENNQKKFYGRFCLNFQTPKLARFWNISVYLSQKFTTFIRCALFLL